MTNIESRISKLEKQTGVNEPERKTWVLVNGEPKPEGISPNDHVIWVTDEEAKELTLRVIAGERTEQQKEAENVTGKG